MKRKCSEHWPGTYAYALILFSACYLLRNRFRDSRVLDFLADISFPLYLIHSMIGYVTMPILIDQGIPYTFAWVISLGLTLLVAFLVHKFVETPVNDFGKRVSNLRETWFTKRSPEKDPRDPDKVTLIESGRPN